MVEQAILKGMATVIVVGAGAAGIIAAWRAASLGAKVILVEKTVRIGTKILISGGGKCNITHSGPLSQVLRAFRQNEASFIRPSCYRFTNDEIVRMLTDRGLTVYTRPDGRIFPVDQTAKDVVRILKSYLDEVGVDTRFETPVTGLLIEDGRTVGVVTPQGEVRGDAVILCVGGSSYPNSGTTGDGWPWAKAAGHKIMPLRAALAPIYMELEPAPEETLSGVALRDILLKARTGGKEMTRWRGDMLYTHQGVSGPTVLGISRVVAEEKEPVTLDVDLLPDATFEQLGEQWIKVATANPRRLVRSELDEVVPHRLVPLIMAAAKVEPETPFSKFDKKARNRLIEVLKRFELGKCRHVPLEKGEVVAGGVSLDEVDPQTMESLKVKGLYFSGEVLDIAGPVGGYNLQAAFATGFVAGESAAQSSVD